MEEESLFTCVCEQAHTHCATYLPILGGLSDGDLYGVAISHQEEASPTHSFLRLGVRGMSSF